MIRDLSVFLTCLLCLITFNAQSETLITNVSALVLSNSNQKYVPENNVYLYEDKTAALSFEQVKSLFPLFKPNQRKVINYGVTPSVIWCMFKLRNETKDPWYIEIGEPYIDYIDLFSIDKAGIVKQVKTGFFRNFEQRPIKVNHFILPLEIDYKEEKTYFIRAQSFTILKLPLAIGTIQPLLETEHKENFANGIYFGLIFALSLYNLFVFLLLRDKTYLYYVFYINSAGALISWLRGYLPEFVQLFPPNINHGNNYAALLFIFLPLFTHSFLNLGKIAPKHKWIKIIFFLIGFITIFLTVIKQFYLSFFFIMIIVLINFPYILSYGFYALKKGFAPAKYYLLGFTALTVGDFIFILSENAKINQTVINDYSLQIGSALEAIILSFALANKLNMYKKEKEETQAKALIQANEFSKELIQTQEAERKRIAGELHDSVGQSLSLIKNRIGLMQKYQDKQNSINELNEIVSNSIQEVRGITSGLRPFQLDILGLTQSIKSLIEDVSEAGEIKFHIAVENIDGLVSKEEEIHVFRIVQECLNNISKHSLANEVTIEIRKHHDNIEIAIEDNGIGISASQNNHGFGLIGIKERINILDGKLEISNIQPKGTRVWVYL